MADGVALLLRVLAIGVGATAFMDIVAIVQSRVLGTAGPDYAPVARWIGHMPRGQFRHGSITAAAPVAHEHAAGWLVHYVTGIAYAVLLVAIWGTGWVRNPTILPPLILLLVALVIPFLIMQPAFGFGIAGSKLPRPWAARSRSIAGHVTFGIGLYLAARLSLLLFPAFI
ncbi:MAG TPA: DUF2938 family protein [Bauldia sp.]|nr:DUF2938 family protein [Bauldia sp.]